MPEDLKRRKRYYFDRDPRIVTGVEVVDEGRIMRVFAMSITGA